MVYLITDFHQYYDHYLHNPRSQVKFYRMTRSGLSRSEMFYLFHNMGLKTPACGTINLLSTILSPQDRIVVYKDEYSHQGKHKEVVTIKEASIMNPSLFASRYMYYKEGISVRLLGIGNYQFIYTYKSDDWRSNYGNVKIEHTPYALSESIRDKCRKITYPLFAIDFVYKNNKGRSPCLLAIDYNIAPGVPDFLSELLPAKLAAKAIKDKFLKSKKCILDL